jgi:nitroreductase/FMN reductase [NAD(P)H]
MPPDDPMTARYGLDAAQAGSDVPALIAVHPELAAIMARRTQRHYTRDPVDPKLIDALLDIAFAAPSKSDFQQTSVIKVEDTAKRRALADLVPAMPWIGAAPVFLVFCADARRLEQVCALRGKPRPNRNLEAFFNAAVDAALVLQTFMLAAGFAGLGCCPISVIRNHLDAVARILALPEAVVPVAGLTVGHPAAAGHISMRLPPAVTRMRDAYRDNDLAAELAAYDRRREARYATPPGRQRDSATFGVSESYGWSEDKARHAHAGEGAEFGTLVRARGFVLD